MPSQRRTPRAGPGGSRGPRQGSSTHPGARGSRPRAAGTRTTSARTAEPVAAASRPAAPRSAARRPRFTGRAAVLVLVLAVLTVSYASSLRAYLQQRSHIGDLKVQIAEREASINDLEREKKRWDDPAYVKAQASLNDPDDVIKTVPTAWWTSAWESMELAGNPPPPEEEPVDLVDGTKQ